MDNKTIDCKASCSLIVEEIRKNMPEIENLNKLSDFFKVMGDKTRIQLLWALEEKEMCVGELAAVLDMTKSAVSHQLKVLRLSKLVKSRKTGKNVYYSLDDDHIKIILQMGLEHAAE